MLTLWMTAGLLLAAEGPLADDFLPPVKVEAAGKTLDVERDGHSAPTRVVGVTTDISDHKRAEAALAAERDVLQTLMETLQQAGVPAGMVNDTHDLFEDAQLQYRGHFQYLDHAEIGRYASERSEFNLSRTPGKLDRPAPMMGEHNEYVLRELVGLTEQEYQSLKDDAVLE